MAKRSITDEVIRELVADGMSAEVAESVSGDVESVVLGVVAAMVCVPILCVGIGFAFGAAWGLISFAAAAAAFALWYIRSSVKSVKRKAERKGGSE